MKPTLILAAGIMASSSVMAGGFTLGGAQRFGVNIDVGQTNKSGSIDTGSLNSKNYTISSFSSSKKRETSARIGMQYNFSPSFAAEVGAVDLGKNEHRINLTAPNNTSAQQISNDVASAIPKRGSGIAYLAGLNYQRPISQRFSMGVGVGVVSWKDKQKVTVVTPTASNSYEYKKKGNDAYVRAGVGYRINRNTALTASYDRFNIDHPVDRWGVGMAFRF